MSRRNSTRPAFASRITRGRSSARDDGAGLGVRHQAARAKDTAQAARFAHHIRGGDGDIEIGPAALDPLRCISSVSATKSAPACVGQVGAFALGEDQHAHGLAQAMGQHDHITNLLVSLARIQPRAHVNFNRSRRTWRRRFL